MQDFKYWESYQNICDTETQSEQILLKMVPVNLLDTGFPKNLEFVKKKKEEEEEAQ